MFYIYLVFKYDNKNFLNKKTYTIYGVQEVDFGA
jgi:hypothetical protein